MIAAGAYLRVSTEDQGENYSLPNQRDALTLLAARHGVTIVQWYEDSKSYRGDDGKMVEPSARRSDRPAWRQMLADVGAGKIAAILALDHTRLAGDYQPMTDLIDAVERSRAQVLLVSETFDTELSIFHSWARRQWYRQNSARSHAGRRSRTAAGLHPGKAPNFYRVIRNDKGKSIGYELIEEYRPWLNRLAELFISGTSYLRIAMDLGRNPTTGRAIDEHGVKLMLRNPWYRGLVEFGQQPGAARVVAKAQHPPVWDAATCAAIEAELERRATLRGSITHGGKFLFSGILRCGVCGHVLTGQKSYMRNSAYNGYYCSTGLRIQHGRAEGTPHRNHVNEKKLISLLRDQLAGMTVDDVDALMPLVALPRDQTSAAAPGDIADLERQAQELRADLDAVTSAGAKRAIATDLERITRRLESLRDVGEQGGGTSVDLAALRAGVLALVADPGWLEWPKDELRPVLLKAFPALYVYAGALCPPPG